LYWDDSAYAFARVTKDEKLVVVFNAGSKADSMRFSLDQTPVQGAARLTRLFGGEDATIDGHEVVVTMKPQELAVYLVR
jgi:sorbitol-specific phosphotransferase system component IIA